MGCWSPLLWARRRVGRCTACQHSELHYFLSCRVMGGRGIPQSQQLKGLRDQVSRVVPEKQLRARAPECVRAAGRKGDCSKVGYYAG